MSQQPSSPDTPIPPAPTETGRDQTPAKIRSMFSDITPTYDRLNFLFSGSLDRYWRLRLAREIATELPSSKACLLDVATGTGDLAAALLKVCGKQDRTPMVTGADFTRPMLAEGARKYGHKTFRWVEADGLALPFATGVFDAVTVAFGLRNMADKVTALAEMTRVMKPGGRLGILEFSEPGNWLLRILYDTYSFTIMPWLGRIISGSEAYQYLPASIRQFWSRQELSERMKQAGLTDVRSIALMGGVACIHLGTKVE